MTTYAQKYMAGAIGKFELQVERIHGGIACLKNQCCTIYLENIDNDYVRFEFSQASHAACRWEFANFLNCQYDGRGMQLRPLPPRDYGNEAKFIFMLEKYDALIVGGYFDKPLLGDFSWEQQYDDFQSERKRLSSASFDLGKAGHPEAEAILNKELDGDPTWMDDVRRILAEQGG